MASSRPKPADTVVAVNVLLTGPPRCGKTTVVERVVERVVEGLGERVRLAGFVTSEVRAQGDRVGFDIVTAGGVTAPLSRKGAMAGPRVGSYRVNVPSLERVAVPALGDPSAQAFIVDEIGLMELVSPAFREAITQLLDDPRPLLGTIRSKPHPFCDRVKARPDVELVAVTRENRDDLVEVLATRLRAEVR
jgi:nucleoside-triphosphatase